MTKIVCISDTHGQLPQIIPDSDVLLIAGDICCHGKAPEQLHWLNSKFRNWLEKMGRPVIGIAGNHDWAMYEKLDKVRALNLPWTYLQDESTVFNGLNVYGTPWQKKFFDWSFNLEEYELMGKWNLIPDNTDILICHSPPKYYGDKNPDGEFIGSESLTWRIGQLHLRLMVFGHAHSGYGTYHSGNTTLVNASLLNEEYRMVNKPIVVEI
jgi:Icc-related predicted phosphoesterase